MLSKRLFSKDLRVSFLPLILAASACGVLGEKKPATNDAPQMDIGCFDELGPRVKRYFNGDIEAGEWNLTFDCVNDQVTKFRKYVRGGATDGSYDKADIADLIRRFLLTKRRVGDEFVASIFELKASVFGGADTRITPEELDAFLRLSEVLRVESTKLLPALQGRKRNPTPENLLKVAVSLEEFGIALESHFASLKGTLDVTKASLFPFVRELLLVHGGDESLVDRYGDFVLNLKVILVGGAADKVERNAWSKLIKAGCDMGGVLLAFSDSENLDPSRTQEKDRLLIELLLRFQTYANRVIATYPSGIPLALVDPLIDTLPWDELTLEKRAAVKHDLRQGVFRLLKSGVPDHFTKEALANIVKIGQTGLRLQVHLKKIYESLPVSPQKKDFEIAALKYKEKIPGAKTCSAARVEERDRDCAEIDRLIEISKTYVGLFTEDSGEMLFNTMIRETRTRNHMTRMAWFRTLVDHLFSVYATGPEQTKGQPSATVNDLANLTQDFLQVLKQWKMAHPEMTALQMAEKRFLEGNLFMPNSNGDSYFSNAETTYYLAFLVSSNGLSGRMDEEVTQNRPEWSACPIVGVDQVGQPAVEASCFRKIYFSNPQIFWSRFPGLQVAYAKMTPEQKAALAYSMESAARRGGYTENPIGPYDMDGFSALTHYVEDMLERFDENKDEILNRDEILDLAFPIFRETLAKKAPTVHGDTLLKGVLTHIVHYGYEPKSAAALLAWTFIQKPLTDIAADRNAVYNVVALLSAPKKTDP